KHGFIACGRACVIITGTLPTYDISEEQPPMTSHSDLTVANRPIKPFAVGEQFPNLALPNLDGDVQSIGHFQGKKTLLLIWASW
ncbi:MAG: hypothetical protein CUN56_15980, partial [Phototrophicales bacterium]